MRKQIGVLIRMVPLVAFLTIGDAVVVNAQVDRLPTVQIIALPDRDSLWLNELIGEDTPPTVLVLLSVDLTGKVQDARVLPSLLEPTAAEKALALEYARTIRFGGLEDNGKPFHQFEVLVTIYASFGQPKERK